MALVGNSFGAQVAVEAALRHPSHVERLVLIGPTVDPAARGLLRQYVRWQRNAPDEHLSVLPVMARDLADIGLGGAARMLRIMLADRLEAKLPRIHQPTLVLRGSRDRLVPEAWARAVAELLPDAVLRVVPGYAHMPQWSGPRAIAPLLREFLAPGATRDGR
jgi:pimeloyl-ACP methyl ester carboxylesterase